MEKDVLSIRTVQQCPHQLTGCNFEFDALPHTQRPLKVVVDLLKRLIKEDPRRLQYI